ncbi:MAG: glycosyltransferase family 2 protein [Flavobacteriaceae bacterium]|jgi:GT2 family glycosyltransferase|nr:glycosyltransferase family 2 protein [Flavobacteriaceae bacterium]
MKSVAIAILNWNGENLLKRFLKEVVDNSPEATVYLIDNASTDESVDYVKKNHPRVSIVLLDKNYGYAGGYNRGMASIKEDIFCLLNNDVLVNPGWLTPILDHFQKHPKTAIAQPHIMDLNQPDKFEYAGAAGGFIDRLGYPYCRGRFFNEVEKDGGQYDKDEKIFWASGACFFIRKEVFESMKGFDEDFFAHMEEIDLCWRAFNQNLDVFSLYRSKVFHLGGGTLKPSPRKVYLNFRNSLYLLLKNLPEKRGVRIFERLLWDGIAVFYFILKLNFSNAFAVIRAHYSFYVNYSKIKGKRSKNNQIIYYYSESHLPFRYFFLKKKNL